jgi:hypothetical protein
MQIYASLLLLLFSFNVSSKCDFKPNIEKVISLSGTVTVLIKEMGLLAHPKLQGISVFNPIHKNEFSGEFYPGGIFLSHKSLEGLDKSLIFFDESRDLKRIFNTRKKIISHEVKTRNMTPMAAIDSALEVMSNSLTGCDEKIKNIKFKATNIQNKILKNLKKKLDVVFYIGDFRADREPETIMANDGVVKWLRKENKIQTYPTNLAYVNWSAKILKNLPGNTLHIGVIDPGNVSKQEIIKRSPHRMTFLYSGSLVPGLSQLEAFLFLTESL